MKSYFPLKHDHKVIAQGYARTDDGACAFVRVTHANGASCTVFIKACKGTTIVVKNLDDTGDCDVDMYSCTIGMNTVECMCKNAFKDILLMNDEAKEMTLFAI